MFQRGRNKEILFLLVHSSKSYNNQKWIRLQAGVRNSIGVFHMDDRGRSIWGIFCSILRILVWMSIGGETIRIQTSILLWDSSIISGSSHIFILIFFFLKTVQYRWSYKLTSMEYYFFMISHCIYKSESCSNTDRTVLLKMQPLNQFQISIAMWCNADDLIWSIILCINNNSNGKLLTNSSNNP